MHARIALYNRLENATALGAVVASLQWLATIPFILQRVLLRLAQPLFLTVLMLVWFAVRRSRVLTGLFVGAFLLVLVGLAVRYVLEKRTSRRKVGLGGSIGGVGDSGIKSKGTYSKNKIAPLSSEESESDEDEDDNDDDAEEEDEENDEDKEEEEDDDNNDDEE